MKIVINKCFGGFSLSKEAVNLYKQKKNITDPNFYDMDIKRNDPVLVEIVQLIGARANGSCAELEVVEIPDDVKDWYISEYDGAEHIAEGRTWS